MKLSRTARWALFGVSAMALSLGVAVSDQARAGSLFGDMLNAPHDWSGPYIGGQAGYVHADAVYQAGGVEADVNGESFLGGGHIGYNWQNGDVVFGVIADANFANMNNTNLVLGVAIDVEIDFTASLRGKFGIAVTDRVLLYATGGLAIAEADHAINTPAAVFGPIVTHTPFSNTHLGFTAGGGIEMAITEWISAFVEYRLSQYGGESHGTKIIPGGTVLPHDFGFTTHQVQAGLSIHFNSWLSGGS